MANDLAIDGGRPAVQADISDGWKDVTDVERTFIDSVLDDIGSAYDQNDLFEAEYRAFRWDEARAGDVQRDGSDSRGCFRFGCSAG